MRLCVPRSSCNSWSLYPSRALPKNQWIRGFFRGFFCLSLGFAHVGLLSIMRLYLTLPHIMGLSSNQELVAKMRLCWAQTPWTPIQKLTQSLVMGLKPCVKLRYEHYTQQVPFRGFCPTWGSVCRAAAEPHAFKWLYYQTCFNSHSVRPRLKTTFTNPV